jgi:hypothetical protein
MFARYLLELFDNVTLLDYEPQGSDSRIEYASADLSEAWPLPLLRSMRLRRSKLSSISRTRVIFSEKCSGFLSQAATH